MDPGIVDSFLLANEILSGKSKSNLNLNSKTVLGHDDIIERSPNQQYIRYNEILGRGAFKTVYKGFDEVDGIEVAWNQVNIEDVVQLPENLERLYSEVHLLKTLKHENIIRSYVSWVDDENKTINMITELFTSGNLRQYRQKHKSVDMSAIKNWARQILRGLEYLHTHNPPIIHRDLKCDNIFVNGNQGEIKIGDLGFAAIMQHSTARSVIGTPEFMAPELYEEEYNELVDIYSFGMFMLELVTCEYPYSECKNHAQIYKKVTSGIRPAAFSQVKDPQLKQFIESCLVPASLRSPASELLKDPFLSSPENSNNPQLSNNKAMNNLSMTMMMNKSNNNLLAMDIDSNYFKVPGTSSTNQRSMSEETPHVSTIEMVTHNERNEFRVKGERCDENSVSLIIRIAGFQDQPRYIHFMFYLDSDTAVSIATEMVEQLSLLNADVAFIAELIDTVVLKLVHTWIPSIETNSLGLQSCYINNELGLSVDKAEDYSMKLSLSVAPNANHNDDDDGDNNNSNKYTLQASSEWGSEDDFVMISSKNSGISFANSDIDLSVSSTSSVSIDNKEEEEECYDDLKVEIKAIEMQYRECCSQLTRMREHAIQSARKRWISKENQKKI